MASSGSRSSACCWLRSRIGPASVNASALRPLRVGITQSNRSTPRPIAFQQIDRPADAHQVPRLIARQQRRRHVERRVHFRRRLADAQAADRVADEIQRHEPLGRFGPQLRIEAALHDGEQRLIGARRRRLAALGPAHAAPHGVGHDFAIVGQRDDVIEHHRHVAAELLLNGDGPLRRQLDRRAVDVRAKANAAFVDASCGRPG